MMTMQSLFEAISHAHNEQELRSQVMAKVGEYFQAHRWGLFFFGELAAIENIPSIFKLALSVEHNPVLRYLVEHHAVVHEELLLPPGGWQIICRRSDHAHVMAGPIVGNGRLLGTIGFTRILGTPAFNSQDLTNLSALCLHLSTWWVMLQVQPVKFSLTPREQEIAELVAKGLTNAEIGATLWITENSVKQALKRMFRKLEVSSRAEMITRIYLNKSASVSSLL
jgi:DNA-binding CsgD family transcriptional regulator